MVYDRYFLHNRLGYFYQIEKTHVGQFDLCNSALQTPFGPKRKHSEDKLAFGLTDLTLICANASAQDGSSVTDCGQDLKMQQSLKQALLKDTYLLRNYLPTLAAS